MNGIYLASSRENARMLRYWSTTRAGISDPKITAAGPYRFWKIEATATESAGYANGYLNLSQIALRATPGGANQCIGLGGSATESSNYGAGYGAIGAFEESALFHTAKQAPPMWAMFDCGVGVSISVSEISITNWNVVGRAPKEFNIQGSNDGSGFDLLASFKDVTGWVLNVSRAFTMPAAYTNVQALDSPEFLDECASLATWTNTGCTITPAGTPVSGSIKAYPSQRAYRDTGVTSLVGKSIQFRAYPQNGGLVNFMFGRASDGSGGSALRMEGRSTQTGHIYNSGTSWTDLGTQATGNITATTDSVWHTWRIDITSATTCDVYQDGVLKLTAQAITLAGGYIGVHGDAGSFGGFFDSISIGPIP